MFSPQLYLVPLSPETFFFFLFPSYPSPKFPLSLTTQARPQTNKSNKQKQTRANPHFPPPFFPGGPIPHDILGPPSIYPKPSRSRRDARSESSGLGTGDHDGGDVNDEEEMRKCEMGNEKRGGVEARAGFLGGMRLGMGKELG